MSLETSEKKLFKMIQYVEQEGHEKADEINAKSEDEFDMEKKKLVKEACIKIDVEFYKKRKLCKKRHKMELTMMTSSSRKDLIRVKQKAIDLLLEQIKEIVTVDMKCPTGRWAVLQLLIMEGLFKLLEEKVVIRCREQDASIIEKYIPELENTYLQKAKKRVKLTLDTVRVQEDPIPTITLLVKEGKIYLICSLRERIDQIFEYFIPVISSIFYETKKFDTRSFSIVTFY